MEPAKDKHSLVEFIDVLLREGAVIRADVVITVADIPLVGISLHAAIGGMTKMREHGLFEDLDVTSSSPRDGS